MLPRNDESLDGSDLYQMETLHLDQLISSLIPLQHNPYTDCSLHPLYLSLAISPSVYQFQQRCLLDDLLEFHSTDIFYLSFSTCYFS